MCKLFLLLFIFHLTAQVKPLLLAFSKIYFLFLCNYRVFLTGAQKQFVICINDNDIHFFSDPMEQQTEVDEYLKVLSSEMDPVEIRLIR